MSNPLPSRLPGFLGPWRMSLALPLLLPAVGIASAHGATGDDKAFLEQSTGRQLIVWVSSGVEGTL